MTKKYNTILETKDHIDAFNNGDMISINLSEEMHSLAQY